MFCAPRLIFGVTEGVGSHFQVLRARTHFRRYRGRPIPFSCFTIPNMFFAVPSVSDPVFMFCAPGLVFVPRATGPVFMFCAPGLVCGGTEASGPVFKFCAPRHIFGGTEGVVSYFHVLRVRTHFWRKRECRVPFSCFALPESCPAVPRASCPVFKFCAPGLVFCDTAGIGSRF
jgi:hypothetical protein